MNHQSCFKIFQKRLYVWMSLVPFICYSHPVIPDSVSFHIQEQIRIFPQEKVYLHLDRPSYLSGEKAWFKLYITDASLHQPVTPSVHGYVELVDPFHQVVERVKVLQQDSTFSGYIDLPETLPQGQYTVRGYTRYMQNLEDDYFFTTSIFVGDPLSATIGTQISYQTLPDGKIQTYFDFTYLATDARITPDKITIRTDNRSAKELNVSAESPISYIFANPSSLPYNHFLLSYEWEGKKASFFYPLSHPDKEKEFTVSFFPEGGYLLTGVFCTVGFKAMNASGTGAYVTGEIYDNNDRRITDFESLHLGMGRFSLIPEAGKQYYAICKTHTGESKRFELPQQQATATGIQAKWWNDKLALTVVKGVNQQMQESLYLIGHIRGQVQFTEEWDPSKEAIMIDKKDFPSGVLHILLINVANDILSERLVYCHNEDQGQVEIQWNKPAFNTRDKITGEIRISDSLGKPLSGHLSVSITDNKDLLPDSTRNLSGYLLLESDLKGYIEDPLSYFRTWNKRSEAWIDCLMLTQGWRRYAIPDVIKGQYVTAQIPPETYHGIEGNVRGMVLKKPVSKSQVILTAPSSNFMRTTETDEAGNFKFRLPSFPDSTRLFVQALTKRGGDLIELVIEEESFPGFNLGIPISYNINRKEEEEQKHYWFKANQKYTIEHGMRHIYLSDIEITASYKKKTVEHASPLVNTPDVTITLKDIKRATPSSMQQLMSLIPLAGISNGMAYLSRNQSDLTENPTLIMVDGIKLHGEIDQINVHDVAQLDVIKPPRSVIADSRAINGVIFITTKRGDEELTDRKRDNIRTIMPLGFQQPLEFYSPVYKTEEQKKSRIPDLRTTIYWNPNIQFNGGLANIEFYSADTPAIYTIKVEGVSWDGKLISQTEIFHIID